MEQQITSQVMVRGMEQRISRTKNNKGYGVDREVVFLYLWRFHLYIFDLKKEHERVDPWKEKSLIENFIGIWSKEKYLLRWIKATWNPKGHYDLHLGSKGFFTIILFNKEDMDRVMNGGSYLLFSAGFYLQPWKDRFNPDKKYMSMVPIWILLYCHHVNTGNQKSCNTSAIH